MNKLSVLVAIGMLSLYLGGIAEAQPAPPPTTSATMATPVVLGVDGFIGLPIGDFAEGVDLGIGALFTLSYNLNPQLDLTGRAGLIYFLLENSDGVTFYDIPFWFGGRYKLSPGDQGPYLHGEVGFNHYRISVDGFGSNSETEIGVNLLGGIKMGTLTLEGGLYIGSIDESFNMLGGTVGTTF